MHASRRARPVSLPFNVALGRASARARAAAIRVPTIAVDGDSDGVNPGTAHHAHKFEGFFERRVFTGAGHNLPQERPAEWARAVLDVRNAAS